MNLAKLPLRLLTSVGYNDFSTLLSDHGKVPLEQIVLVGFILLTGLALPFLSQTFVDGFFGPDQESWPATLVASMIIIGIVRGLLVYWQRSMCCKIHCDRAVEFNEKTVRQLLYGEQIDRKRYAPGELADIVIVGERSARQLTNEMLPNLLELAAIPVYFAVMAWFDVRLMMLAILLAALNGIALRRANRVQEPIGDRLSDEKGKVVGGLSRDIASLPAVQAGRLGGMVFAGWHTRYISYLNEVFRLGRVSGSLGVFPSFVSGVSNAVLIAVGATLIMRGELSIGSFVACQTILFSINDPIYRFLSQNGLIREYLSAQRRRDIITKGSKFSKTASEPEPLEFNDRIIFEDLSIVTSAGKLNIRKADLAKGSVIGVAGHSLIEISLICETFAGLRESEHARILADDRRISSNELRTSSVYLTSQTEFFTASLRENLRLWRTDIDDSTIWSALEIAGVADVVNARVGKLDTLIAEGGRNFSSGQRQRLGLARALLSKPSCLVLNNSLDSMEVGLVYSILDQVKHQDLTVILSSARPAIMMLCDDLITIDIARVRQLDRAPRAGDLQRFK